jgi:Zn-dependent protease with chaperone function
MIDTDRLDLIRLELEARLQDRIEQHHSRTIRKMVREIEGYFTEMDYEEMVRDEEDREEEETARYEKQVALAQGIVVTRQTSSHLYSLVERAMDAIGLEHPSNLTINVKRVYDRAGEDLFNAFCVHAGDSVFISFTPMLLNVLDDEEILDVIGHELGHAASRIPRYLEDYFYFAWGRWEDAVLDIDPDIPDEEIERLKIDVREIIDAHFDHETDSSIVRIMRLKELTSDRFGLVASRSLEASCRSLMRQETLGLDPRFFDYDHRHLLAQLDELGDTRKDPTTRWLFDATHPVLPARVAALDVFARTERFHALAGGESAPPGPPLDAAAERAAMDAILRKSELVPEGEDLAEVRLVACLLHRIVSGTRNRREPRGRIVRRLVWEFYRDFYAAIPAEVFDIEFRRSAQLVKTYGRQVADKPEKDRKSLVRDIVAFVKQRRLMSREARDLIVSAAQSMGLPRAVAITYLKRVGAWKRFTRGL